LPATVAAATRLKLDEGVVGWVARARRPVVIDGRALPSDLAARLRQPALRCAVVLPIEHQGATVGVLNLSSTRVALSEATLPWLRRRARAAVEAALAQGVAAGNRRTADFEPVNGD
jgi:putative methionine-R-sulfoxide reductase with GAF domain